MKDFLKQKLSEIYPSTIEYKDLMTLQYSEDVNEDVTTGDWLENRTSFIYKVGVLAAIDNNKCDYVYIAIGTQRTESSEPVLKGSFYFNQGENDDMGRVIKRALNCLEFIHSAFEQ